MIQQLTFGYIPKRIKRRESSICIHVFIVALFTVPKHGSHSSVHLSTDKLIKYSVYMQWNITQPLKGRTHTATWMKLKVFTL
jgi:hypothetical protein